MRMQDFRCNVCGRVWEQLIRSRAEAVQCCGENAAAIWAGAPTMVPDTIVGGLTIENLSAQPQTFYSRSEHKRAMDKAGLVPMVRHVPSPGSDKNREGHTSRWV